MAIPLLDALDIQGKDITADALLTQRKLANYLIKDRQAHYHFTVKGNQPTLLGDIAHFFQHRKGPDFLEHTPPEHGRIETRKIWTAPPSTIISISLPRPSLRHRTGTQDGAGRGVDGNTHTRFVISRTQCTSLTGFKFLGRTNSPCYINSADSVLSCYRGSIDSTTWHKNSGKINSLT